MTELALVAKATSVLALALLATTALRTTRASVRALLLSSAFGVLLLLPAAGLVIPERTVEIPADYVERFPITFEAMQIGADAPAVTMPAPAPEPWRLPSIGAIFRAIWAVVAFGILLHLAHALRALRDIRRTGVPWLEGTALTGVDVFLHDSLSAPMTFGVRRPAIGLPVDAPHWDSADLRRALVHEMEHVRRGDWIVHLAARVSCALYWFHPLAWIAARQWCLEAERACDDAVLRQTEGTAYAEQLVSLARRLPKHGPAAVLSMAARSDLSTRVRAILDVRQARGPAGMAASAVFITLSLALAATISPLQAVPVLPEQAAAPSTAATAAFEVASVRRSVSADSSFTLRALPGGTISVTNAPLQILIRNAHRVQDSQIVGAPGWVATERWDVTAKAGANATPDQLSVMLQSLLADRFQLRLHREQRDVPVYALTLARADKRLGVGLRRSPIDCAAPERTSAAAAGLSTNCTINVGPGTIRGRGQTMRALAGSLSNQLGMVVVDRTGLSEQFDFELSFTPDAATVGTERPSLFTALQEQLGVTLESTRAPVEVLVIDSVERASANDAPQAGVRQPPPGVPQGIAAIVDSPTTGSDAPRFDAASIKRSASRANFNGASIAEGGQLRATNSTLARLIQVAYGLRPTDTVTGGPDWARSDGYDVDARPAARASVAQARLMLRTLLADRFGLDVRVAKREMPVYALTLARADRRLGPQIARPAGECTNPTLALARAANAGKPLESQPSIGRPGRYCGIQMAGGRGMLAAGSTTLTSLATLLTPSVDRPVIDRTGLAGVFDFDLQFAAAPRAAPAGLAGDGSVAGPPIASTPGEGPSLFTALQEQLGLKLEATTGFVDVLEIVRAERPSEN